MSTNAPAPANHTGATPTAELSPKPTSVAARTASANRGTLTASSTATGARGPASSDSNERRSTNHSTAIAASHGSAMRPPKRRNDRRLDWKASRLVRLEIGSNSEALLARCEHA